MDKVSKAEAPAYAAAAAEFGSHEQRILVLQGGGALGAYQAGVYEGLATAGSPPTGWPARPSVRSTPR